LHVVNEQSHSNTERSADEQILLRAAS